MARTPRPPNRDRILHNFLVSSMSDVTRNLQLIIDRHPDLQHDFPNEIAAFSSVVPQLSFLRAADFLTEHRNTPGGPVMLFLELLTDLSTSITDIMDQSDFTLEDDDTVERRIIPVLSEMHRWVSVFPNALPEFRELPIPVPDQRRNPFAPAPLRPNAFMPAAPIAAGIAPNALEVPDPPIPVPDQRRNPFAPAPLQPNAFMPAAPIAAGIPPNAVAVIPHRPLFASAVPVIPSDNEPVTRAASLIGQNPAQANIAMDGRRIAPAARPLPVVPVAADPQFDDPIRIHRRVHNNPLYVLDNILAMTRLANENMHRLRRRVPGATQDHGTALRRLSRSTHHLDLRRPIDETRRRLRHSYEQAILARQWVEAYIVSDDVFTVGLPHDGRRLLLQGIQPMILDITAAILQLQHIYRQR